MEKYTWYNIYFYFKPVTNIQLDIILKLYLWSQNQVKNDFHHHYYLALIWTFMKVYFTLKILSEELGKSSPQKATITLYKINKNKHLQMLEIEGTQQIEKQFKNF